MRGLQHAYDVAAFDSGHPLASATAHEIRYYYSIAIDGPFEAVLGKTRRT
jgi:hypothetical protein